MKKVFNKLVIAVFAAACIFVVNPETVKAENCDQCTHTEGFAAYYKGNNEHEVVCYVCGNRKMQGCTRNSEGWCQICDNVDPNYAVKNNNNYNGCAPYYNPYYYNPYYLGLYNPIYALDYNRAVGNALPAYALTMNVAGIPVDVASVGANAQDTANQLLLANTAMAALGNTNITPSKTYCIAPYICASPIGTPQVMTWNNCGLAAGDTAFVVYWNPIAHSQILPVTVGANGSANFIVPDVNGAQITLIKVNK